MATAIINSREFPYTMRYFEKFPYEPCETGFALPVSSRKPLAKWNLINVLKEMEAAGKKDKNVVIVSHGNLKGIRCPLIAGKPASDAEMDHLNILMSKSKSKKDKAQICHITETEVDAILAARENVLNQHLNRVELRACNLGTNLLALAALRNFFGSKIITAPKVGDYFGLVNTGKPTKNAKDWAVFLKRRPAAKLFNMPSGKIAIRHLLHFSVLTESDKVTAEWIKKYLPHPNGPVSTHEFPVHALLSLPPCFPMEPGYAKQISAFKGGNPLLQGLAIP